MSHFRNDGEIRRSQILTSAGPGALVDLMKHAVVIKGLDDWRYADEREGFFREERLEAKVLGMLRAGGRWTHNHVRLRRPPACDDDDAHPNRGIHVRTFPRWFLCQNPRCHSLVQEVAIEEAGGHLCIHSPTWPDGKRVAPSAVVPIRFVSACRRGHLVDILWSQFVHRGEREEGIDPDSHLWCHRDPEREPDNDPLGHDWTSDLYLKPVGTSGDITDYIVGCRRCGRTRGLQDLVLPNVLGQCKGWRPWLGRNTNEDCDEPLKLLIRTGTNAYFPIPASVLSIPDSSDGLRQVVRKHWDTLKKIDGLDKLTLMLELIEPLARDLDAYDPPDVLEAIRAERLELPTRQVPVREAEWFELLKAPIEVEGDLPERGAEWFPRRLDIKLPDFLDRVVLVHALREVRAQVGFTRLDGSDLDAEGEMRLFGPYSLLSERQDWVPALEIYGEGVFLAFNEQKVREWEDSPAVQRVMARFYEAERLQLRLPDTTVPTEHILSARLLMLHSLAHMLITAISLECGYSASAIRERIYCHREPGNDDDSLERSRAGILLYTGTPGSEGTLGGLVEVGRDILTHLRHAVEMNLLCSNDPVCAQHDPAGAEEGRHREGAACHACLLIAEPSCERRNRDLDRTLVVPTVENSDAAFLRHWIDARSAIVP